MNSAIDNNGKLVLAADSDYGIYLCPECRTACGLKKPFYRAYHFFHLAINSYCSLCHKKENIAYENNVLRQLEIIGLKNTTKENWFKAIDYLISINELYRLSGCAWAIEPLNFYVNKYIETLTDEVLFSICLTILNIDTSEQLNIVE